MRTIVRFLSGVVLIFGILFWLMAGANLGWTHTYAVTNAIDPVTGLTYPVTEKRFIPGIDLLTAVSLLCIAAVILSNFLPDRRIGKPVRRIVR